MNEHNFEPESGNPPHTYEHLTYQETVDVEPEPTTTFDELDWAQLREVGLGYARRFNLPYGEEEDIVQVSLKRLFAKTPRPEKPYGYLRTIVGNACIDFQRSGYNSRHADGSLPEAGAPEWRTARTVLSQELRHLKPGSPLNYLASQDAVRQVLEEVPENHRALFLDYIAGHSSDTLAKTYGYSSARSVNQTLTRIKAALREKFQDPEMFRN